MSLHGGGPAKPRTGVKPHEAFRTVVAEGLPRGFRHYALKGRYRPATTGDRRAMAERYARLAARMALRIDWDEVPPRQPGLDDRIRKDHPDIQDNPYLPAGYTYLLQFVAHDMVSTRVPFWATTTLDQDTANDRGRRLRLDALYGDGPATMRMIYAPNGPDDLSRSKLRIGRSRPVQTGDGGTVCPFRDIARLKLWNTQDDIPGRGDIWQDMIMSWLRGGDFQGMARPWDGQPEATEVDDVAAISIDPPLLFFVLFEACKDPESLGCRLGRFGSILVADTLFGELNNRLSAEQQYGSLSEQLRCVHPGFGDPAFDGPVTMASVIGFVDRCLQASDDPAMKFPSLL